MEMGRKLPRIQVDESKLRKEIATESFHEFVYLSNLRSFLLVFILRGKYQMQIRPVEL